jgi:NTP pyrophosphatase (non-canonical NTP hydrolase)
MDILNLTIEILAGLAIVIPLVIELVKYVKKSTLEKNWSNLIRLVMNLMAVAEEKFDNGADRKQWVIAMVQASANTINYPITEKELGDLIDDLVALTNKVNVKIEEVKNQIEKEN